MAIAATILSCSSPKNQNVKDATYVKDGDTINPLEGSGEGTAGNKYMESADNADSTKEVQQDLDLEID